MYSSDTADLKKMGAIGGLAGVGFQSIIIVIRMKSFARNGTQYECTRVVQSIASSQPV